MSKAGNLLTLHTGALARDDWVLGNVGDNPRRIPMNLISRDILTANRTYYVAAGGDNDDDGLAVGTAWATLQYAANFIAENLDLGGFRVVVQVGAGSFAGVSHREYLGGGQVYFRGDPDAPSNVTFTNGTTSSGAAVGSFHAERRTNTEIWVNGIRFDPTGGPCIDFDPVSCGDSSCIIGDPTYVSGTYTVKVEFAGCQNNSYILIGNIYDLGSAHVIDASSLPATVRGFYLGQYATAYLSAGLTISGATPAWTVGFLVVTLGSVAQFYMTVTGTATGRKFDVGYGAVIVTHLGLTGLPGSTEGVVKGDGKYIYTGSSGGSEGSTRYDDHVVTQATTPVTLTALLSKKTYSNEGATALIVFNLPTAQVDLEFTFIVQDADGIQVTAASGDTIRRNTNVTAAAGNVASTAIGSILRLRAINATEWIAVSEIGTWA